MNTREWIIGLINDGAGKRYGPRGGDRSLVLPFDGLQIVSASIRGHWHNDSTGGCSIEVELVDGGSISIDGDYHDGGDDTLSIPVDPVDVDGAAAAGLLVPPSPALPFDLDASTLRIFAQALMEDGEWNGIVHTLNGWADFLDTQETQQ